RRRFLAVRGERFAALRAGLAAGEAQLDDLFRGEERQALQAVAQLAPVEAATDLEHLALGEAALSRRGAYRVGRLQREQRLVAVHRVHRRQRLGEVRVELAGADLHQGTFA